jgi:hypothetical protein
MGRAGGLSAHDRLRHKIVRPADVPDAVRAYMLRHPLAGERKDRAMNRISITLLGAALLAGLAMPTGASAQKNGKDGEAEIAKAIAGRTAGKPTDCINLRNIRSSRIVDRTAILYEMNNGVIYVNRPRTGAETLDWNDILVTNTFSSQLCSIDTVKLYDNGSRMVTGWVGLGEFVPYPRAPRS